MSAYPEVIDPSLVGTYPASSKAGGGYVWDAVLEYRVWCHPQPGTPEFDEGGDYYFVFEHCEEALVFSKSTPGAEEPIALVLQEEYIDEPEPGIYVHIKEQRITEWPVHFLKRPRRTQNTISAFLSPDAPTNRLDILRGLARG